MLYMNLRPVADKTGFPLRDDTPASILTGYCETAAQYATQCCALFSAIFELIGSDISDQLSPDSDGRAVVENWSKEMCTLDSPFRAKFFVRLQSTYEKVGLVHYPLLVSYLIQSADQERI
jgi:hypothetical protein